MATANSRSSILRESRPLWLSLIGASILFLSPLLLAPLAATRGADAWRSFGLRGETVLALSAVSSEDSALLFAQTPSGLWRMRTARDTGEGQPEWTRIDEGLPHSALGAPLLAAWKNVPGRPLQLYALAGPGGARQLYRSDDAGSAWRSVGPAPGQNRSLAMVVLPGLGQGEDTIIIATQSRVQRSLDGGATWAPGGEWPATNASAGPVLELLAEAAGSDRLLALEEAGRLWSSENGGLSWHNQSGTALWSAVAAAPYFSLGVWAVGADGAGWSVDGGTTWAFAQPAVATSAFRPRNAEVTALTVDPRVFETVYTVTANGGIYRITAGEPAWEPLGAPPSARVTALAVDPDSRATLYAATDDGVWLRPVVAIEPTSTPSPSLTAAPSSTPQPTATATATRTATASPTNTPTMTATSTPTMTATSLPTTTPTATATATRRATQLPTLIPTATDAPPTVTPTPLEPPPPPPQPEPTSAPPQPTPTPLGPR